ncbi:disease resistance protein RGA2-like [Oryza brachyantha]|uniref:disease resistance protein RGA2-like n=1 Tax=Oryza brachyantha TaxID=4533 RepID=UPI001ADCEBCD|nr:disease resistance protein RGA2-like [Oryza brachyantha]
MDVAAAAGVVGGFLQVVFDKYYGSKLEQWAARSGLRGDFLSLKNQLHMVRAMLEAAAGGSSNGNGPNNESLRSLIVELKSAAYAADNVLDEMEYYRLKELVEDTGGGAGGTPSSARQVVGRLVVPGPLLSNPFKRARTGADDALQGQDAGTPNFDQDAVSSRIKSISCCLEQIAGMVRSIIELDKLVSMANFRHVQPEVASLRQTSSIPTESKLFGRDETTNSIVNLLLRADLDSRYSNFNVLPIVGIGGVGKTALAQWIYNHQRVIDSFQVRAWACVSDTLDVRRVIMDIIDSVDGAKETPQFHRLPSLDATLRTLMRKIEGKRFLIVLDDVWVSRHWEKLSCPLSSGMSGSMVLLTTRHSKIAKAMGTFDSVTLEGLDDNDFWVFFLQCTNITEDHTLVQIGRKIAHKLYGNPLAAKTMGRFLCENHDEEHWCKFLKRNIWELKQGPDDIMPVLLLSYQHLPLSLQRCFIYCAIFPRGYKFTEQELTFAWMAQGLIPTLGEDQTLEDVAKEYINELLSCSFFHIIESGHYMMPGLLHDLAQLVAEGECQATNGSEVVFVQSNWPSTIRLLSLPCTFRKEQLAAVGSFIHLRYLDLRWSRFEELPEAVCKLYLLQVLNIKHCPCLLHLPSSMSNLLNFELLIADEGKKLLTGVPYIGNLTSLNVLDDFCVRKIRGFDIAQLKRLRSLRGSLKVQNLENVDGNEEASKARLSDKRHLTELWLSWSVGSFIQEPSEQYHVLEGLAPHSNQTVINLSGGRLEVSEFDYNSSSAPINVVLQLHWLKHVSNFHIWARDSLSVRPGKQQTDPSACNSEHIANSVQTSAEKVKVTGCGVTDELLSAILENEIYPSSLSISDCPQITSLDLRPLRSLKSLAIQNCVSLKELFGLQSFTALKDLEMANASSFAEAWSELLRSGYAGQGQVTTSLDSLTVDSTLFLNSPLCVVLTSLKKLTIRSDFRVTSLSRQQEKALLLLTSLQDLGFIQCCNLHSLPSKLHKIFTLKQLEIDSCPCVESLPSNGLPEKLEKLIIRGCSERLYTSVSMMDSDNIKLHLVDR